jgi:predicted dehydrogenase
MTKLRAGVVGVGHLGQHHARLYSGLPDSTLVGVTDQNPERAKTIGDRHGAHVYQHLSDLLRHVDVVSVAVPTSGHYAVAKMCLEAGKHVLVEKPIAVRPEEARELVALAAANGCTFQVGHSERFNPIMQTMRPKIQRPAFIEGHRLGSFSERGTDVDVILDLMIHDLDLVLSFNPGPIDIANARIQFQSGCVANLTASRVSLAKMRRLRLFQRDSYVSIDFQSRQGMIGRRSARHGERPSIELEEFKGNDDEPLKLQIQSFLHAVQTRSRPMVSGEDGAAALEVAHQVLTAIDSFAQHVQKED